MVTFGKSCDSDTIRIFKQGVVEQVQDIEIGPKLVAPGFRVVKTVLEGSSMEEGKDKKGWKWCGAANGRGEGVKEIGGKFNGEGVGVLVFIDEVKVIFNDGVIRREEAMEVVGEVKC
ncbi:hypothetical protein RJT34_12521 [Clitoria ternatea]|uniref:Uncharacterized protein n=1 Tax=Clitoria ternatea TaxID=43366 RepID=A0AAN9JP30_CLITE